MSKENKGNKEITLKEGHQPLKKGHQPTDSDLDTSNPPQGGSGVISSNPQDNQNNEPKKDT